MTVDARSSRVQLRRAYLKLSQRIHPDKLPGCEHATAAFQALQAAFDRATRAGESGELSGVPKHDDGEEHVAEEESQPGAVGAPCAGGGSYRSPCLLHRERG